MSVGSLAGLQSNFFFQLFSFSCKWRMIAVCGLNLDRVLVSGHAALSPNFNVASP
jgi:hypothetical protein